MSRFYLTTAIDYVNSRPHLGTAYEKITADVIARFKRLLGVHTHFLMGNDEHSQNVYRRALELGMDPLIYCDQMEREFRDVWGRLEISFDDFIRTSQPRHRAGVTLMLERIAASDDLYEGWYEGPYCVSCEAFKPVKDLVDGLCPVHMTAPDFIREKNHFFRLSKYQRALVEHFGAHPEFLQPEIRRNEIVRLLQGGLDDISVSRAGQHWGIPLPADPGSVVYVWFDALINYASAVGFGTREPDFDQWWPADLHVIGKDITRFHCVVWPAMLMSAGLPLPRQVFGHGFVHLKGQKMSKSLGTVLDPLEAAARFGPDPLRLYLVKEIPYGQDGDFSWERFEERYNVDLANNLGNLVNRVAVMVDKYCQGRLPPSGATVGTLAGVAAEVAGRYRSAMDRYALHEGVAAAFDLVDATNAFIAEKAPWTLARRAESRGQLNDVLGEVVEAIRAVALLLLPVMPQSSAEILRRVGETRPVGDLRLDRDLVWSTSRERIVAKADPLWPRLEGPERASQAPVALRTDGAKEDTMTTTTPGGKPAPEPLPAAHPPAAPERISIDEFTKIDLRAARVVAAERVKGTRKLVKMEIDLGTERRTIVAGIAEAYEADALVGKSLVVVTNLQPVKIAGIESNGMLLAASPEGGQPVLVGFEQPPAPGTKVR